MGLHHVMVVELRVSSCHYRCDASMSEDGGGAMGVGTGWCATDGVEDAHRVRQGAPCTVFYWVYLEERLNGQIKNPHVRFSLGTVGKWFKGQGLCIFSKLLTRCTLSNYWTNRFFTYSN